MTHTIPTTIRLAAVLGTALAVAALASAAAPTKASWAKAANAVCATENARITKLPRVTGTTFLSDLKAISQVASQGTSQLAAIPGPTAESKLIASLIAKAQTQNRLVLGTAIPAVERGDSATTNRTMNQVGKLGDQYNAIARQLGATTCAKNPMPSGNPPTLA